ncbi:MAG: hypothetical protein ABIL37_02820 [candidate division WOR-3 bacterium]
MRCVPLFLIFSMFFACSKKSDQTSPETPSLSNYEVLTYWGFAVGKTHKYYSFDSSIVIMANQPQQPTVTRDTFIRFIKDTFGNLNIMFYDSFFSNSQKIYDTLYVANPFIMDTININWSVFSIRIGAKAYKSPLSSNDIWTPVEKQSKYVGVNVVFPTADCSLHLYLDTLKVDGSQSIVLEASPDTSFKLLYKTFSKIKYRYQTKPQTQFCSDTTMKNDTVFISHFDTVYLKAYNAIMKSLAFDSSKASFQIGNFPVDVIIKSYSRREKVQ